MGECRQDTNKNAHVEYYHSGSLEDEVIKT